MFTYPSSLGIVAGLAASTIWGGALAMTRLAVSGDAPLGAADVAILRFAGPAILLFPVLRQAMPRLRQVSPWLLGLMILGGGAPFALVAGTGLETAGAAEAGALLPGMVPLCVAMVSALLGERFGLRRGIGLMLIALAAVVIVLPAILAGGHGRWAGYALLLIAAVMATGYTIALRLSGIGAWEAAAFVSTVSLVGFGPVYLLVMTPGLSVVGWHELGAQAAYQGIASGIMAPVAFGMAVRRLGAAQASAFASLSPGAACAGGFALMGEVPDTLTAIAVIASGLGVALVAQPARIAPAGDAERM
ncbi:DMT family transporter [Neoroseomonas oryzicola]|uniref:DMT family transporter n=1 Tax=Neoroseomonas oryzicola TaxID=535904 RepID=A0A9X9WIE2_9PROT|nr:DMT family transporter [Neoroseomonas oryzicola]MBR0660102.1 DMT family transporter [Neoroseomonas oryzicola]NKE18177.1 DMT family transporter [Neoroseomonas oryzicola]